jgi:hypothetical protein
LQTFDTPKKKLAFLFDPIYNVHTSTENILKTNFCLEQQILLHTTCTVVDQTTSDRLKELIHAEVNWTLLLQLAEQHCVIQLLYLNLKKLCFEATPLSYLKQLQKICQLNTQQNFLFID